MATNHYYYQVMRKTIIQFLDLFNDLTLARYDTQTGDILKYVSIPLKFSPKGKDWYWEDKTDAEGRRLRDIILPMMAVHLTGLDFAQERITNITKYVETPISRIDEDNINRYLNPTPYDFTFELNIASEYMIDVMQIIEQILPYFNPTRFIRITIPELGITHEDGGAYPLDLKVTYEGATQDSPITIDTADYRTILWTLNFKVEGYLFRPVEDIEIIKKIHKRIYTQQPNEDESNFVVSTLTTGISAEKYPIPTTEEELSGSLHDEEIKLWYTYERDGN